MRAQKVSVDLADPAAAGWSAVEAEAVRLAPVPIDQQPTEYVREKWADRPYGTVRDASVAAAHDGSRLYVRIEFADGAEPNGEFHDAAGVYFPADTGAPAGTVGAPGAAVHLWYWQANLPSAKRLTATGPGVFRPAGDGVDASAACESARWAVVLQGALADAGAGQLGVAVWNGSNEERAGLGAVAPEWLTLEIE